MHNDENVKLFKELYIKTGSTQLWGKLVFLFLALLPSITFSQTLSTTTTISITKIWSQMPDGYTYPINISIPDGPVPKDGFPVCILLHGNGGNGANMVKRFSNIFNCHALVAPSGYMNSWNISDERSEAPDVEMIDDLINNLQKYTNINPNSIRILGSSNGAALANRVYIENTNTGVDIICAIVSQLSEAQYHNGNFYSPGGSTGGPDTYDGYDIVTSPISGRKYLSICNRNDPIIPYNGGASVGVNFLDAQLATYIIAKNQGYVGNQLPETGTQISSTEVYEYSYLSGQVVHLVGNAKHGTNDSQINYIINYFSDCSRTIDLGENYIGITDNHHFKTRLPVRPARFVNVMFLDRFPLGQPDR